MFEGTQFEAHRANGGALGSQAITVDESLSADPMMQHLSACQNIAVTQARRSFNHYLEDLEIAFDRDIKSALNRCEQFDSAVEQILVEIQSDVKSTTETLLELNSFTHNVNRRQEAAAKRAATFMRGESHLRSVKYASTKRSCGAPNALSCPQPYCFFYFNPGPIFCVLPRCVLVNAPAAGIKP